MGARRCVFGLYLYYTATSLQTSYKSKYGYEVQAEMAASGVRAENFDGVVIPGGMLRIFCAAMKIFCGLQEIVSIT